MLHYLLPVVFSWNILFCMMQIVKRWNCCTVIFLFYSSSSDIGISNKIKFLRYQIHLPMIYTLGCQIHSVFPPLLNGGLFFKCSPVTCGQYKRAFGISCSLLTSCVSRPWVLLSLLSPGPAGGLLLNQSPLITRLWFQNSLHPEAWRINLQWHNRIDWLIDSFLYCWNDFESFLLVLTHLQLHLLKGAAVRLVGCIPNNLENAITFFLSFIQLYVLCACLFFWRGFACLSPFQDLTMKLSLIQSVGLIAKAISECVRKQGYVFSRKQELITVMLVSGDSFILY